MADAHPPVMICMTFSGLGPAGALTTGTPAAKKRRVRGDGAWRDRTPRPTFILFAVASCVQDCVSRGGLPTLTVHGGTTHGPRSPASHATARAHRSAPAVNRAASARAAARPRGRR